MPITKPDSSTFRKLRIEYEPVDDDIYHVRLLGTLGMGSTSILTDIVDRIFDKGCYKLIIDLDEMVYMASCGIGFLVSTTKSARVMGGEVVVAGASPKMMSIFEMLELDQVLTFAANAEEALRILRR